MRLDSGAENFDSQMPSESDFLRFQAEIIRRTIQKENDRADWFVENGKDFRELIFKNPQICRNFFDASEKQKLIEAEKIKKAVDNYHKLRIEKN